MSPRVPAWESGELFREFKSAHVLLPAHPLFLGGSLRRGWLISLLNELAACSAGCAGERSGLQPVLDCLP